MNKFSIHAAFVYHSREAIKTLAFRAISRGTAARSLASVANLKCPTSSIVLFPVLTLLYLKGIPADEDVCEMGSELGEPAPCHSHTVCREHLTSADYIRAQRGLSPGQQSQSNDQKWERSFGKPSSQP